MSLFWMILVVGLAVLLGRFTPPFVIAGATVVLAITWRISGVPFPASPRGAIGAAVAVVGSGTWALLNSPYASQILLVQRDGGFLTLQGLWLSEHPQAEIPLRSATALQAAVPGVWVTSDAFGQVGDHLVAQGAKALPGLVAVGGWVGGVDGVLLANLVIGALALLAVYDFGRRLTGPIWGLVPMAALGSSMPLIYFSRAPFTEPVNVALMFTGMSVLWVALSDPRPWRFALGGAIVGSTALSRIDGAAAAVGVILGLGVAASLATAPQRRTELRKGLLAAGAGAALLVVAGYLDLRLNSPFYLADHSSEYRMLVVALLGASVGALVASWVAPRVGISSLVVRRRSALALVLAATASIVILVLVSRPLWMQGHEIEFGSSYFEHVQGTQASAGVPLDGTRSYDELTVNWIAWYLGWPTVLISGAGLVAMIHAAVTQRRADLALFVVATGAPALLYMLRPSITPDHVWAMRRFLPVVLPAVLLVATWALMTLHSSGTRRWAGSVSAALAAVVLIHPVLGWRQLLLTAEHGGRLAEVQAVCDVVGSSHVVSVRTEGPTWLPTVRIACGADVVELRAAPTRAQLAKLRSAWGSSSVVAMTQTREALPWSVDPDPFRWTAVSQWPETLGRPGVPQTAESVLYAGTVEADGSVTPYDPSEQAQRPQPRPQS
ncbi:MAG: hypothetical protein WCF04_13805 [Candidatus Nanopelagicales bacterium]